MATMRRLWDTGLKWIGCVIAMPLLVLAIVSVAVAIVDPAANYNGIGYLVIAMIYAGAGVLVWGLFWFIGRVIDAMSRSSQ